MFPRPGGSPASAVFRHTPFSRAFSYSTIAGVLSIASASAEGRRPGGGEERVPGGGGGELVGGNMVRVRGNRGGGGARDEG